LNSFLKNSVFISVLILQYLLFTVPPSLPIHASMTKDRLAALKAVGDNYSEIELANYRE